MWIHSQRLSKESYLQRPVKIAIDFKSLKQRLQSHGFQRKSSCKAGAAEFK